jgi:F420 biosynthesis protein FbiB-like protein
VSEQLSHFSILETIHNRRSIRRYKPDPIPRPLIETLLEAAIWAPSAHNRQPWRFVVIENVDQKDALARAMGDKLRLDLEADNAPEELIFQDVKRSYERITSAPVLILICLSMIDMDVYPDDIRAYNEYLMAAQSTAMAGQNLLLAAQEADLGSCWMCAPLFCPDIVRDALNLPDDWRPQGLITLGYPSQTREKTRRPLDTVTIWR